MRRRESRRRRLQITLTVVATFVPVLLFIVMLAVFWYLDQKDRLDSNTEVIYYVED